MHIRNLLIFCLLISMWSCSDRYKALEKLPASLDHFEVLIGDKNSFTGLIQVRKITDPGYHLMINAEGKVVWYIKGDTALFRPFTPKVDRFLAMHSDEAIYEITYPGDTLNRWIYGSGGFVNPVHHEVIYHPKGIAALTKVKVPIDFTEYGGEENDTLITDGIMVLDGSGKQVWSWEVSDVLNPLIDSSSFKMKNDWGHANALAVDYDGNYLISFRDFNEVWKIDSNSGALMWKYGQNEITNSEDHFYGQHSVHAISENKYLLLDNGHPKIRKHTRAIIFNRDGDSFSQELKIQLPDSLYTPKQGSVFKIDNDRYLFSSSMKSILLMTDSTGNVIWMAKGSEPYYRAYYLEEVKL